MRTQTPNFAVYGDLGCYPLSVIAKEMSINYWLKYLSNNNSLMFKLFQTQIDNLNVHTQPSRFKHKRLWTQGIKSLLDKLGFSQLWLSHTQPSRFKHKRSWAQGIKSLLAKLGFSQLWLSQYVEIPCYEVIKRRIRVRFTQH